MRGARSCRFYFVQSRCIYAPVLRCASLLAIEHSHIEVHFVQCTSVRSVSSNNRFECAEGAVICSFGRAGYRISSASGGTKLRSAAAADHKLSLTVNECDDMDEN